MLNKLENYLPPDGKKTINNDIKYNGENNTDTTLNKIENTISTIFDGDYNAQKLAELKQKLSGEDIIALYQFYQQNPEIFTSGLYKFLSAKLTSINKINDRLELTKRLKHAGMHYPKDLELTIDYLGDINFVDLKLNSNEQKEYNQKFEELNNNFLKQAQQKFGNLLKIENYDNLPVQKEVYDLLRLPNNITDFLKNYGVKIFISNKSVNEMAGENIVGNDVIGTCRTKKNEIYVHAEKKESTTLHEIGHFIFNKTYIPDEAGQVEKMITTHQRLFKKLDWSHVKQSGPGDFDGTMELFAEGVKDFLLLINKKEFADKYDEEFYNEIKNVIQKDYKNYQPNK